MVHVSGRPPSKSNPPSTPSGAQKPLTVSQVEPVVQAMQAAPGEPLPQRALFCWLGAKHELPLQQPLQLLGEHAPVPTHWPLVHCWPAIVSQV